MIHQKPDGIIATDFDELTLGDFLEHIRAVAEEQMVEGMSCEIHSPRRNLRFHLTIQIENYQPDEA